MPGRRMILEISVEDNGCGLSPEDVNHIIGEKVYDSKIIGMNEMCIRDRYMVRCILADGWCSKRIMAG